MTNEIEFKKYWYHQLLLEKENKHCDKCGFINLCFGDGYYYKNAIITLCKNERMKKTVKELDSLKVVLYRPVDRKQRKWFKEIEKQVIGMNVMFTVTTGKSALDVYSQELYRYLSDYGIEGIFTRIPHNELPSQPVLKYSKYFHNILDFAVKCNCDVLHLSSNALLGYLEVLKYNTLIATVHDLIPIVFEYPLNLIGKMEWMNIRKVDFFIVPSNSTKKDLIRYFGIPDERITVICNGIEHSVFNPKPKKYDFPFILYVGSEEPRKNLETLLKAFYKLKKDDRFKDLKFVKVGDGGDYRKRTLDLINQLGIRKDVIFTEHVSLEELPYYYSSAIALVIWINTFRGYGMWLSCYYFKYIIYTRSGRGCRIVNQSIRY